MGARFDRMGSPILMLLLAGGGLALLLGGCGGGRGGGGRGGDDDDSAADDDDTDGDDDTGDDDDTSDDDDTTPADDDDASDDDDTTPPDDDDDDAVTPLAGEYGATAAIKFTDSSGEGLYASVTFSAELTAWGSVATSDVEATFIISYWDDVDSTVLGCEQRVFVEGDGAFGAGVASGCSNCNGLVEFDESTYTDISNPGNPDECDPADLGAGSSDYAMAFLSSPANGGYGDFLTMGLIDEGTFGSLGLAFDVDGQQDWQTVTDNLAAAGATWTHAGYVNATAESLSGQAGIDAVAANAGGSSTWYAWWQLYTVP